MLSTLRQWLSDPAPPWIFEISEAGVSLARLAPGSRLPETEVFEPLEAGVVEASPVRQNVHRPEELDRALRRALDQATPAKKNGRRKDAAVILPDNCARIAVLDFETLPGDAKERASLIRWRLKKGVPFDVDSAALSYQVQRPVADGRPLSVLVAVSPIEVITQYEAAIRKLALQPGYVSVSVASTLNLLGDQGVTMLVKLAGRVLSLVVTDQGQARLVRTLEAGAAADSLTEELLREMTADLYPTFVYIADNFGAPVGRLMVAGFGPSLPLATEVFRRELGYEAEALKGPAGLVNTHNAGIWGYLAAR